jgi:hypothetical protein
MTGTIVCQFNSEADQWVAYFGGAPQAAFGGSLPVVAIRRLLEGLEAPADLYTLVCDRDLSGSGILQRSFVWEPPEMLFVCPSCDGKGEYVGLMERETCEPCGGRGLLSA